MPETNRQQKFPEGSIRTIDSSESKISIDIVIPTYQRGEVLLETIEKLSQQSQFFSQLIIVDQTIYSPDSNVAHQLKNLNQQQKIHWLQLDEPSIPNAMNQGLLVATANYVLFLDDDISPAQDMLEQHQTAVARFLTDKLNHIASVGQILQPNEIPTLADKLSYGDGFTQDLEFPFNSTQERKIYNCMAGNLLVNREKAIECGGFDTHFTGVAYRFETEFCRRFIEQTKGVFFFVPQASLRHLKLASGGTRAKVSNFLTSMQADHSKGEYYFILRRAQGVQKFSLLLKRLFGSIKAKFYLRQPWWIPVRFIGELRGLLVAVSLVKQKPKLIHRDHTDNPKSFIVKDV